MDIGQNASIEVMLQRGGDNDQVKGRSLPAVTVRLTNGFPLPISCEIAASELDRKQRASSEMS